jgi:hypothetical protein
LPKARVRSQTNAASSRSAGRTIFFMPPSSVLPESGQPSPRRGASRNNPLALGIPPRVSAPSWRHPKAPVLKDSRSNPGMRSLCAYRCFWGRLSTARPAASARAI